MEYDDLKKVIDFLDEVEEKADKRLKCFKASCISKKAISNIMLDCLVDFDKLLKIVFCEYSKSLLDILPCVE